MNTQRLERDLPPVPPSEAEGGPHWAPGEVIEQEQAGDPPSRQDEEIPAQLG
jgi:hypothetical protein